MSSDRELLELAAKAARLPNFVYEQSVAGDWNIYFGDDHHDPRECWNPLTDDGDALRLGAILGLHLKYHKAYGETRALVMAELGDVYAIEFYVSDVFAATRRAIVRAAAEIGRSA